MILGTFGTAEIMVILFLALLLFGGKKIPELMKGLGIGIKEFKKASENNKKKESETNSKVDKIDDSSNS